MEKVRISHVYKTFAFKKEKQIMETEALKDVNLSMEENEVIILLGPSGCGKTTLLRMIDGLIEPTKGEIHIGDKVVKGPGPDRGFVFQSFRLLPWRTAQENVEFPLEIQGVPKEKRRVTAQDHLKFVGLAGFEHSYGFELSGGMQQRVGLARALALDPELLLMDEPFASLDAQTRELLQIELVKMLEKRRKTTIFVTHSIDEALFIGDTIVVMSSRPGRVVEVHKNDLPKPRWEYNIRANAKFIDMREHIWQTIKDQVKI